MAFLETDPDCADLFRRHGLASPDDFLALPGAIVGGHADRHTLEVLIGAERFFLKKEHVVPLRDRLASAWDGHGFVAKSVREGRILRQSRQAGIGCPTVAALGEERGRAFLLLRAALDMWELRVCLLSLPSVERCLLAQALGRAVARMHGAGFNHPDLYAKHVLAGTDGAGYRFCFLDWQRSRHRRSVVWRRRYRDLAALNVSLVEALASPRLRLACLRAYLSATAPLRQAAVAIHHISTRLLLRRKVTRLRQAPLPIVSARLSRERQVVS
jgi:tRNA A-37 threonylcarbamoyl transferase component Bud32